MRSKKDMISVKSILLKVFFYLKKKVGVLDFLTPQEAWRIVKYGISGVTGGVVQVTLLYVFVDYFGLWYIRGVVFAFTISLAITFVLQKFWTFQDYSINNFHQQSFKYVVIALGALLLNVVFMYVLVDIVHLWHIAAQGIVVGVVGGITFLMNRAFTFNGKASIQ